MFSYIPGLSGVTFREARVGIQGRARTCCNPQDGVHEQGEKEGMGIFQLTAEVANIPIWGTPRVNKEFDFGIVSVSVDFQMGFLFTTNFRINAQGGVRVSACDPDNSCAFGETNVSIDPEVRATFTAEVCTDTIFTSRSCAGLTITPLAVRMNFAGRLTYNKPSCSDGLGGSVALGALVVRAEFAVGGRRLVFQYRGLRRRRSAVGEVSMIFRRLIGVALLAMLAAPLLAAPRPAAAQQSAERVFPVSLSVEGDTAKRPCSCVCRGRRTAVPCPRSPPNGSTTTSAPSCGSPRRSRRTIWRPSSRCSSSRRPKPEPLRRPG